MKIELALILLVGVSFIELNLYLAAMVLIIFVLFVIQNTLTRGGKMNLKPLKKDRSI
jgi:hypothetical protein